MKSTAHKVKDILKDANTYTLEYGYGFSKGRKIEFPQGTRLKEKRKDKQNALLVFWNDVK